MQRWRTAVLMMLLCLTLSACAGTEDRMQEALKFRTALLAADSCQFEAELTAQGETEVYTCRLLCAASQDGAVEVTVAAPEEIEGVKATVSSSGTKVEYDGVRVDFGRLSGSVTPVGTPGLLYAAWTGGYIAAAGAEEGTSVVRYLLGSGSSERQINTRFSADGTPELCEIVENGEVVVRCLLSGFQMIDKIGRDSSDFETSVLS